MDYVRSRPTWARGEARIDGDEIVLDGGAAEEYAAFDFDHATRLLFDLGNLANIGEIIEVEDPGARLRDAVRLKDTGRALEFAGTHGLLWHGSARVDGGEVRESLKGWYFAGLELAISTAVYLNIRQAQEDGSAEPVRRFLRMLRDARIFKHIRLSEDDSELLDFACIQLAERISRGMADCTPTLSAVGGAGDFRFGNDPASLVGAANYQLALFVSRKKLVRECAECEELFLPTDPRQREHTRCGNRKRKRKSRQKQKAESPL